MRYGRTNSLSAAVVTLVLTSGVQAQTLELQRTGGASGEYLGYDVDVFDDTAVIGSAKTTGQGQVAVLVWDGSSWSVEATLSASDGFSGDSFGGSVSLNGDRLVVGAPNAGPVHPPPPPFGQFGAAYVFARTGTVWSEQQKIFASDAAALDGFGKAVGLDGNWIVVGSPGDDGPGPFAGTVYTFEWSGSTWSERQKVQGSGVVSPAQFGWSCSLNGDTFAVNARLTPDTHVFVRNGTTWVEQQRLVGQGAIAHASVDGDTLAVGQLFADLVTIYERSGTLWSETASFAPAGIENGDGFGASVDLVGDDLIVGATEGQKYPEGPGSAYVYARLGTLFGEQYRLTATGGETLDAYGFAVAVNGLHAVVAAPWDDVGALTDAGSAFLYELPVAPVAYCTAGTSASGCRAVLCASGVASASAASGFELGAFDVEGDKDGLFFYATNGRQANPWGNGTSYKCVVPPVKRGGLLAAVGAPGTCDGSFTQDLNARWCPTCPRPLHSPGAGAFVQVQLWYRDPFNPSNQTTSFSNAIEFFVGP